MRVRRRRVRVHGLSAAFEQPLVRAYVLGNGKYPDGNVQESGQRSWAAAAVALGLYSDDDDCAQD